MYIFYANDTGLYDTVTYQETITPTVPQAPAKTIESTAATEQPRATATIDPVQKAAPAAPSINRQPAAKVSAGQTKPMKLYHIILGAFDDYDTAKIAMQQQRDSNGCSCLIICTGGEHPYKLSAFRYNTRSEATEILDIFRRTDPEYRSAWVEKY
jgi:hypothetical protein